MPLEKRTRVEIFLPIRSDSPEYQTITQWLAEELGSFTTWLYALEAKNNNQRLCKAIMHVSMIGKDTDSAKRIVLTQPIDRSTLVPNGQEEHEDKHEVAGGTSVGRRSHM